MRAYNERITAVDTDQIGRPVGWTWRARRYEGGPLLDCWVTTQDWWREAESLAAVLDQPRIQHWLIEAASDAGNGPVELALDEASGIWRLVGVLD